MTPKKKPRTEGQILAARRRTALIGRKKVNYANPPSPSNVYKRFVADKS